MRIKKQRFMHPNHKLFGNTLLSIVAFLFVFACSFIAPKMSEQVVPQVSAVEIFAGGDGTQENPYQISNVNQLNYFRDIAISVAATSGKHYILTNNIDLAGVDWRSIYVFDGSFDGNGYCIENLSQRSMLFANSIYYAGLFGILTENAEVFDLGVDGSIEISIASASVKRNIGLLAGKNAGLISNCFTTGSINVTAPSTNEGFCGGVVGFSTTAISDVFSQSDISDYSEGNYYVGGIIGSGDVSNSYYVGTLSRYVQGESAIAGDNSVVANSHYYATGEVSTDVNDGYLLPNELKLFNPNRLEFSLNTSDAVFGGYPLLNWLANKSLLVSSFNMPTSSNSFANGNGSAAMPYLITSVNELAYLQRIATNVSMTQNVNFRLAQDLDLSAYDWQPIEYFSGVFDGGHHIITGLTMVSEAAVSGYKGFFANLSGTVKDLGFEDVCLRISLGAVGAIAGNANGATITGCYVTGTIRSQNQSGALVAFFNNVTSSINTCFAQADVNLSSNGLSGNQATNIRNSYFVGEIQATNTIYYFDNSAEGTALLAEELKAQDILSFSANTDDRLFGGYPVFSWLHNTLYMPYVNFVTITDSIMSENVLGPFELGDIVTLTATPPSGYEIEKWIVKNYETSFDASTDYSYVANGNTLSYTFSAMDANSIVYLYLTRAASPLFSGGNGTINHPYLISNSTDLKTLSSLATSISVTQNKYYVLQNNIDMANIEWTPIHIFAGRFYGEGRIISNITISSNTEANCGLFGQLNGAVVRDLGLKNCSFVVSSGSVGFLAGESINSNIEKCFTTGSATRASSSNYTGGIVGQSDSYTRINACFSQGNLSGRYVSGIAGGYATISNSYYVGTITATNSSGGICYRANPLITNSFHNSNISDTYSCTAEELRQKNFGANFTTNISNEYGKMPLLTWVVNAIYNADIVVISTVSELQNLSNIETTNKTFVLDRNLDLQGVSWEPISNFKGTFNGCGHIISNLTINSNSDDPYAFYGLFSFLSNATIKNLGIENYSINLNHVNCGAGALAGGVGIRGATITNCYARGTITNSISNLTLIGGLIGYSSILAKSNYLNNNYSIMTYQNNNSALTNAFAIVNNMEGESNYYNAQNLYQSFGATGVNLDSLTQQSTFANWNFDYIWSISESNYPTLRSQPITEYYDGLVQISFDSKDKDNNVLNDLLNEDIGYTNGDDVLAFCTAMLNRENVTFSGWYKQGVLVSRNPSIAVKANQACTYTAVYINDGLEVNYNNIVVTTDEVLCTNSETLLRDSLNILNSINFEVQRVNAIYGTKQAYYTIFDTYNYISTVGEIDDSLYGSLDINIYYYVEHSIIFDSGGSIFTPPEVKVVYKDIILLPTLSRDNYSFNGWCTDIADIENTTLEVDIDGYYTVPNLNSDLTVYAIWILDKHLVSAQVRIGQEAYGTISGAGQYDYGSTATLTATANTHYRFVEWRKNNIFFSSDASILIVDINKDEQYEAVFEKESYSVTLVFNSTKAIVTGAGQYEYESLVTVETSLVEGNLMEGWYVGDELLSMELRYSFNIVDNIELSLRVSTEIKQISVATALGQEAWGEVLADNEGSVYSGDSITIIAYPSMGYRFVCWKAQDSELQLTTNAFYIVENVRTDQCFVAYFEAFSYDEYSAEDAVEITPQGDTYSISEVGHLVWLSNQVNDGTSFAAKTFVLANDITLEKHFVPIGFSFACSFDGRFDFAGYKITGLKISNDSTNRDLTMIGLFGYLKRATVLNANIEDLEFDICNNTSNSELYVGGLVGIVDSYSVVSYARLSGHINASCSNSFIGGVLGRNDGEVSNIDSSVSVSSAGQNTYVGGILGEGSGSLKKSISKAFLVSVGVQSHESYAGGLVGYTAGITMCDVISTNVMIDGGTNSIVGQFVGMSDANLLTNCSKLYTLRDNAFVGNNNALASSVIIRNLTWFLDETCYYNTANWEDGIWNMSKWGAAEQDVDIFELKLSQNGLNSGSICVDIISHANIKNMYVKIVLKSAVNEYVYWAKSGIRFIVNQLSFGRYEVHAYTLDSYEITTNYSAVELSENTASKLVEVEIYESAGRGILLEG